MRRITEFQTTTENDRTVIDFGESRNFIKLSMLASSTVELCYVQNAVVDAPISLGKTQQTDDGREEFFLEVPVSATHLYLCSHGTDIKDIRMYENEDADLSNLYPKCFDIHLDENYCLDTVTVFTAKEGYSQYSLYTSLNGRDFDLVSIKDDDAPCGENGDLYLLDGKEARVIRVYYEYHSISPEARFDHIEYTATPSKTPYIKRPEIDVCPFDESEHASPITEKDTLDEVYGIVARRLGNQYCAWFDFAIGEKKKYDYFRISSVNGKIQIKGNNGVSIAAGLNHYLKNYCKVCISQVGDQAHMPPAPVIPSAPIYRETKAKIRYAYNYCTLSYSNAFWGEREWRDELDWLALNGVNVILDINGQEEVWRRFLGKLGYSTDEVKSFLTGPAHFAWLYMSNITGLNAPIHDSWFEERTQLARNNHRIMRCLGMEPVLQGYSGIVPVDIQKYDANAEIIPQGKWCAMQRPAMLKTDTSSYQKYARLFYEAQKEVLGKAKYFATDPFHEGGITGGMSPRVISKTILSEMLKAAPDAVWVIQSWQGNPTTELLLGLKDVTEGEKHALILDLYAEKAPNYIDGRPGNLYHGHAPEFDSTPWVYCMLNNFGGRLGLHGHLDNIARDIPKVLNTCGFFSGIGMTCEASENNPVLYDFLFESVWQENADDLAVQTDLNLWIKDYTERRYGKVSASANKAWEILLNTVYKAECNMLGQGAPECVVNARPRFGIKSASTWGNSLLGYPWEALEKAEKLLSLDKELLCGSKGYQYDLVSVRQQVLSNRALTCYRDLTEAYRKKDIAKFKNLAEQYLKLADEMNAVTAENRYYTLSRLMDMVDALTVDKDDFTKRIYRISARTQITTLGSYIMSENGLGHDYSNRQWSTLISDFYKPRWEMFFESCIDVLEGRSEREIDWFAWEWSWVRGKCAK